MSDFSSKFRENIFKRTSSFFKKNKRKRKRPVFLLTIGWSHKAKEKKRKPPTPLFCAVTRIPLLPVTPRPETQ